MKARIVFVEGLPGSGKTAVSKMVYDILTEEGIASELWYENSLGHPTDFDGTAYLDEEGYQALRVAFPGLDCLSPVTTPYLEGYLVSNRKALEELNVSPDPGLLHALVQKDVYELEPSLHIRIIQKRWKDFVREHQDEAKVFLFECVLLQNPVTALKVKHDVPDEVTMRHIGKMMRITSSLEPVLLYVNQGDFRKAFLQAVQDRPGSWYEGFERYYTGQGYGLAHGFSGTEGVLRVLEERARVEKRIREAVPFACRVVDNSARDPGVLRNTLRRLLTEEGLLTRGIEQEKE